MSAAPPIQTGRPGHERELRLDLFGTEVRVLLGIPVASRALPTEVALERTAAELGRIHQALTRFDPGSELSRLNSDRDATVAVSPLLRAALEQALWAARRTNGLVDPTLVPELERAGYADSRTGRCPAPLSEALASAPPRRIAQASHAARWKDVRIGTRSVSRPPGVRFDLGGTAKGLAADLCAARLGGYSSSAVDVGGDIVVGGVVGSERTVVVDNPLTGEPAASFPLVRGAVATSGLATRVWRLGDGFAHHLLDPSTGMPAWTGVIQATAVGHTGVEAEALAKAALLSGPRSGLPLLERLGGALILDDGGVLAAGLPGAHQPR